MSSHASYEHPDARRLPGSLGRVAAWSRGRSLVFAVCLVVTSAPQVAGQPTASEYAIKAAFLYNFATFVEWPAEAFPTDSGPLVIGVLGANPFGSALEGIVAVKRAHDRRLVIKQVDNAREAVDCHLLFVGATSAATFDRVAPALSARPVLTVGDRDGFAASGGMVEFVERDKKMRFLVNLAAARQAGLEISSQLLALAEIVGR